MKKFLAVLVSALLIFAAVPEKVNALSGSISMSGATSAHPDDTISVSLNISGTGLTGAEGSITYDSSKLTYVSASKLDGWEISYSASTMRLSANYSDPAYTINGSATLITLQFKVGNCAGSSTVVNVQNFFATNNSEKTSSMSSSRTINVTAASTGSTSSTGGTTGGTTSKPSGTTSKPSTTSTTTKSSNNFLKSLSADGVTLSPAFDKNTTSYTASAPFSISKLNVTATTEDSKAKATVNSPDLAVGDTDVTVTVKAENGTAKTYTIKVTRAQDPNYKPGGNNNLSALAVDVGILSPAFSKDVTRYVVWLPFETEKLNVTGTAEDKKAQVAVEGGPALTAGKDTAINVTCTAENGDKKTYTVIAKRAAVSGNAAGPTIDTAALTQQIQKANVKGSDPVVLDLSGSETQQIAPAIFQALKAAPEATLEIDLGKMKISFKGSDLKNDIGTDGYDFTFTPVSTYKDKMTQTAQDQNAFTYAFSFHGKLPGYATFTLMTDYKEGEAINIYRYNPDSDSYDLIAKDVKVGTGGMVRYLNDTCSDYMATPKTIAGAKEYDSVKMQGSLQTEQKTGGVPILIFVVCLVAVCGLGFGAGIFISTLRARKLRYTNSFKPHVTYMEDTPNEPYTDEPYPNEQYSNESYQNEPYSNEPYDTSYDNDQYTTSNDDLNTAPTADKLFSNPDFQNDLLKNKQAEDDFWSQPHN